MTIRALLFTDAVDSRRVGDARAAELWAQHDRRASELLARYAAGESLQRIAADLNARGARGPRRKRSKSSTWSMAALYGTPPAGSGVLNNEL